MPVRNPATFIHRRQFISERELGHRWDKSSRSLQRWRKEAKGPRFYRFGRSIRYALDDILAFEAAHEEGGEQ